jgi:hypothetical protein
MIEIWGWSFVGWCPPRLFLRKDVILWGLHGGDVQECDYKGVADGGSVRRTSGKSLTRLILRTWGAAVLRPYTARRLMWRKLPMS